MKNTKNGKENKTGLNRRTFLRSTAAIGTGLVFSPTLLAQQTPSPDDINVALLGAGAQGKVLATGGKNGYLESRDQAQFHARIYQGGSPPTEFTPSLD